MLVREIFTTQPAYCGPETNLAAATALLWENDCGTLPVLDESRKVVGIVTDRDLCMAVGTRGRLAADLFIRDVMSSPVLTCRADDRVSDALKIMRQARVRRLPVVDAESTLVGLVALNDFVIAARESRPGRHPDLNYEEVMLTLKAICAHPEERRESAEARLLVVA